MAVLSGIGGAVNGVGGIGNWSIQTAADVQAFQNSGTGGGTGRQIGNKDWSGSYKAYGDTPASMPGEALSFIGSIEGTTGAAGTAIVDGVDIECDIKGGGVLSHTVNFSGNGALTEGAAVAVDATVDIPGSAIGCKAAFGTVAASPVWTDIIDVTGWKLSITAANQAYVNSSTGGLILRKPGNIDATFSISVELATLATLTAINTIAGVRLFTSSTLHWQILWGIIMDHSDITIDVESQAIVAATMNMALAGLANVGGTDTIGSITNPASGVFWPAE